MRVRIPVEYDGEPPRAPGQTRTRSMADPDDHARRTANGRRAGVARAGGDAAAAESFDQAARRSALPRHCVGRRQRGHRDAPGRDERRRERHGQPGAEPPRQGARHSSRCAAAEEHGRHRGDSRTKASSSTRSRPASSPSLIPVTSPYVTPIGIAIYAIKCKDAVIFCAASRQPADDERNRPAAAGGARRRSARRSICCSASSSRASRWRRR